MKFDEFPYKRLHINELKTKVVLDKSSYSLLLQLTVLSRIPIFFDIFMAVSYLSPVHILIRFLLKN